MPTFGETGTSGSGASTIEDFVNGIHNPSPATSGTLDSISAYLHLRGFGRTVKAMLYSVSGTTYTLIDTTIEWNGFPSVGFAWYTFDFATPPAITGGTPYALMVWGNAQADTATLKYHTSGTFKLTVKGQTYNGAPDYTQTPASLYPSIYGTYTESAGGPPAGSLALLGVGA